MSTNSNCKKNYIKSQQAMYNIENLLSLASTDQKKNIMKEQEKQRKKYNSMKIVNLNSKNHELVLNHKQSFFLQFFSYFFHI